MAEYDLSKTIIPYLDRHLVFPLLAHLSEQGIFPEQDVQIAQYELAKETNMVDYAAQLFQSIWPEKEVPVGASLSVRSGCFSCLSVRLLVSGGCLLIINDDHAADG